MEPNTLTWFYAVGVQAAAVVALVYVVTLLGARAVGAATPFMHRTRQPVKSDR